MCPLCVQPWSRPRSHLEGSAVPGVAGLGFPQTCPLFLGGDPGEHGRSAGPAAQRLRPPSPGEVGGAGGRRTLTGCTRPSCPCSGSPGYTGSGGGSHPASEGEAGVSAGTRSAGGLPGRKALACCSSLRQGRPSAPGGSQPQPAGPGTFHPPHPTPVNPGAHVESETLRHCHREWGGPGGGSLRPRAAPRPRRHLFRTATGGWHLAGPRRPWGTRHGDGEPWRPRCCPQRAFAQRLSFSVLPRSDLRSCAYGARGPT